MTKLNLALFATPLIVCLTLFNSGCSLIEKPKTRVVGFPGYFELAEKSRVSAVMDFGNGPEEQAIVLSEPHYCMDKETMTDFLSAKKGK